MATDPSNANSPALSTSSDDSIKVGDEAARDLEETLKQVNAAPYIFLPIMCSKKLRGIVSLVPYFKVLLMLSPKQILTPPVFCMEVMIRTCLVVAIYVLAIVSHLPVGVLLSSFRPREMPGKAPWW